MFDKAHYAQLDMLTRVDYLDDSITDGGIEPDEIEEIARSPLSEEVIFNLVNKFYWKARKGEVLDDRVTQSLERLAKARMSELKSHFPKMALGRHAPGKMEYDTTKEALDSLLDVIRP